MGGSFRLALRMLGIAGGAFALLWHPSAEWVERRYANGLYPVWQHAIHRATQPIPWSAGDAAGLLGAGLVLWGVIAGLRAPRRPLLQRIGLAVVNVAAITGAYALWFEASWGWNYDRAPIETRLAFDSSRVDRAGVDALRVHAISQMNALAGRAHARAAAPVDVAALRRAWLPIVLRGGDDWTPFVDAPKPTIADPFMAATGTSGYINPLTLNSHLATDLLWFERPFSLAHEWSHVAAYAREDEANYIGILTCLRSTDPAVRYSGWLELFLYLPQRQERYDRKTFVPLVWEDFDAIRKRNASRVNLKLSRWSWHTYNAYLKSNHIASGVENYNEVTRLMLGIPVDSAGLPVR